MALSASLYLRQSQSLVMTPQLMQSIQLLQMTHVELLHFIEQEVEKNPLLELEPAETDNVIAFDRYQDGPTPVAVNETEPMDISMAGDLIPGQDNDWYESDNTGHADQLNGALDTNFDSALGEDDSPKRADAPELLSSWKSMPGSDNGEGHDLDDFVAGQISLSQFVSQQIPFTLHSSRDLLIAHHMLDQLDDTGYLHGDLGEIAEQLGIALRDAERVLAELQTLEPAGIFARSLSECLSIQLKQKNRLDPAMDALISNLELLGRRDFASLKKLCGVDEEDLLDMLSEIRSLDPKPGSRFQPVIQESIVPDIFVRAASDGSWLVELNAETLPRVLVNQDYFASVSRHAQKNSADHAFLSDCMQTANWLTRSLDQRARTIMKVATEIVRQQDAFLMQGVDHLRPLNLKTVADAIKMHESTVSRVTANKYMMTPRGLYELKYFFTVSIQSNEGGDSHSAESVRHKIRTMIGQETPDNVLSDDDIVDSLKKSGIEIARRTVAKYREAMNIASSVQRRREKRAVAKVSRH